MRTVRAESVIDIIEGMAAKSDRESGAWLPVWVHLRDTAEMMKRLVAQRYPKLCEICGLEYGLFLKTAVLLAYLHDCGKYSRVFQSKILQSLLWLVGRLENGGLTIPRYEALVNPSCSHHTAAGEAILLRLGFSDDFASIIGAHHGMPVEGTHNENVDENIENYSQNYCKNNAELKLWESVWKETADMALKSVGFSSISDVPRLPKRAQVLLSGLLIIADWLASNADYFPLLPAEEIPPFGDYPPSRAADAWEKIGFPNIYNPMWDELSAKAFDEQFGFMPNEIQTAIIEAVEQSEAPGLFILEAPMGGGKTEAALAAAELLAKKCGKDGIFFGLPTQGTANGLFPRIRDWTLTQTDSDVLGINLIHKNAEFVPAFRNIPKFVSDVDENGGLMAHSFFSGRKQSCLSDFVVATVDQMLMAALRRKHNMLLHLGLSQKVVIVDECHAYDAYMNQYFDRALMWLRAYGAPVVLLSATLPAERRNALVAAYLGKSFSAEDLSPALKFSYPLLTWTDGEKAYQRAIKSSAASKTVKIIRKKDENVPCIAEKVISAGGCVGVIANTVKRAQKFAEELEKIPKAKIILYHAQYVMPDRIKKEEALTEAIGKSSTEKERRGVIVVGTQVLEQSLDIDFDLLITDLCPMDLLIQRIGRLHRHTAHKRPNGFQEPICAVLNSDEEEFDKASSYIYGDWLLWRTRKLLPESIRLPGDIAPLVQSAYAPINENELCADELYKNYRKNIENKKSKAVNGFLIGEPKDVKFENNLHSWLSQCPNDSSAEATVRDGASSVEALVMVGYENGEIGFLPWQNGGIRLSVSECPSEDVCREIARQRLRLPSALCSPWESGGTIGAIETMDKKLGRWQTSHWLRGELILLLDESFSAIIGKYKLNYTEEKGMTYESEADR